MKALCMLFCLFITINSLYSQNIREDFDFGMNYLRGIAVKNNMVAVVGTNTILLDNKLFSRTTVSLFKDGKWVNLPTTIERNGVQDSLSLYGATAKVAIDNEGNIWITGRSLLMFDGKGWNEFYIQDEYHGKRLYRNIVIDQNNRIYFTSSVSIIENNKQLVGFSEIHSFEKSKFKSIVKKDESGYFQMVNTYNNSHPFVVLKDNSVLLMHKSHFEPNIAKYVDLTQIKNDGTIHQHYVVPPDSSRFSDKTVQSIHQDRDGIIWLPIQTGSGEKRECCRGVTRTSDFINYQPLTNEVGLPYFFPNQNVPVHGMTELENGDILFVLSYGNLFVVKYDYETKTLTKLRWQDLLKNSTLIKKSSQNPNYPHEWYEEVLAYLSRVDETGEKPDGNLSAFHSIHSSSNGMVYIAFVDFVLEIPIESITSVPQLNTNSVLYPNPSNELVTIRSSKEISYVTVTNVLGQRIVLQEIGNGSYSMTNVPSGFYNLLVTYTDNSIESHPFIKQ